LLEGLDGGFDASAVDIVRIAGIVAEFVQPNLEPTDVGTGAARM
jgi:hypothetical protein